MATTSRPHHPMVTASLALQLLESAPQRVGSTERSSPTAAFNTSSDLSASAIVTQRKIASLQRALTETPSAASLSYATKASLVSLVSASNNPTSATASAPASTPSSDDSSLGSWNETEDDEDDEDDEDRGRLGAAAMFLSRLSREESTLHHEEASHGGIRRQAFFDER